MAYNDVREQFEFHIDSFDAAIAAGLVAIINSGMLLQLWDTDLIRNFAELVGQHDLTTGWLVLLGVGVFFSLLFAGIVSNFVQDFTTQVMMLSRKSDALRKVLVPLLNFSALGITLNGIGLGYGLVVGIVFYGLVMPAWIQFVIGGGMTFPAFDLVPIILFANYGGLTGLVYGYILSN